MRKNRILFNGQEELGENWEGDYYLWAWKIRNKRPNLVLSWN